MKKKGFTLVELLAVIAILAILVIVAVPNVMKSLKQAKANSFITEVQTILGVAETQWLSDQIGNGMTTSTTTYVKNNGFGLKSGTTFPSGKELQLDGNPKTYVINMGDDGKATSLFIKDGTFCYYLTPIGGKTRIDKTDIKKAYLHDKDDTNDTLSLCAGAVVTD